MIITGTKLNIVDNSGGIKANCIKILGSSKVGTIGSYIIISIRECIPNKKVKKHDVLKGLIVRQKFSFFRKNGIILKFDENGVVLITTKGEPFGNRIHGPIPYELRRKKYLKIISVSVNII